MPASLEPKNISLLSALSFYTPQCDFTCFVFSVTWWYNTFLYIHIGSFVGFVGWFFFLCSFNDWRLFIQQNVRTKFKKHNIYYGFLVYTVGCSLNCFVFFLVWNLLKFATFRFCFHRSTHPPIIYILRYTSSSSNHFTLNLGIFAKKKVSIMSFRKWLNL